MQISAPTLEKDLNTYHRSKKNFSSIIFFYLIHLMYSKIPSHPIILKIPIPTLEAAVWPLANGIKLISNIFKSRRSEARRRRTKFTKLRYCLPELNSYNCICARQSFVMAKLLMNTLSHLSLICCRPVYYSA